MEYMSREVFHQHRDEITAAVRLLLADPRRRKRFQLATVYEKKRRNELLAEVLSTGFGPVVAYSAGVGTMANRAAQGGPGKGVPLHVRQHRQNRIIAPLTGEDGQIISVMSRSNTEYQLRGVDLARTIAGDVDQSDDRALVFHRTGN
jgi:hypothetical protein